MYSNLESDEGKRREVISALYWSLMQNWNIPQSIQDYYGFSEDYRLYHQLEDMDSDVYNRKREAGEVPDILEVDARLTHAVEKVFETVCPHPPAEYLDKLNEDLQKLGQIAAMPDAVHDILHISPAFLVRYGIDKKDSPEECSRQAEKAYRELDARFVPTSCSLLSNAKRKMWRRRTARNSPIGQSSVTRCPKGGKWDFDFPSKQQSDYSSLKK